MPSNNPDYQKTYIKQHYLENKDYYKQKNKERRERLKPYLYRFVNRYKTFCGCIDCGYNANPFALQLDHVRGEKFKAISTMIGECASISRIKDEIRKCEVRCANCHLIITHERRSET